MTYTTEDYRRDYVLEYLDRLTPDEILKKIRAEELLKRLSADDRLKGMSADDRLKGLSPEEIEGLLIIPISSKDLDWSEFMKYPP